ncbi:Uncharacterised protein [Mycobacteroides abscessus subsp. abscessus]|nr:Uncharacterised protein [Mycobacteroides abscessus subsp. abscessus]
MTLATSATPSRANNAPMPLINPGAPVMPVIADSRGSATA